jgi:hypothetical protein
MGQDKSAADTKDLGLTAVSPDEPDRTPVLTLDASELVGTADVVLLPPPPRVRVLVVTFSHV